MKRSISQMTKDVGLLSFKEQIVSFKGDGNCLFRSIAHCVLGDQEMLNSIKDTLNVYMLEKH